MVESPTDQFVVEWQFPADDAPPSADPALVLTIPTTEPLTSRPDATLVRV